MPLPHRDMYIKGSDKFAIRLSCGRLTFFRGVSQNDDGWNTRAEFQQRPGRDVGSYVQDTEPVPRHADRNDLENVKEIRLGTIELLDPVHVEEGYNELHFTEGFKLGLNGLMYTDPSTGDVTEIRLPNH